MKTEIREEFWHAFEDSPYCMIRLEGASGHSEPMTAQLDRDARHEIWFFTTRDNRIGTGGQAMAQVMSRGHDVFACLMGELVEENRQEIWDKHWGRPAEAWFPEGREDPNVIMLRFEIAEAEVWTADPGLMGKLKLLTGSRIEPGEAGDHAVGRV